MKTAYEKAQEHLKDFTKFPTINDIVLLMEEYGRDVSIDFVNWCKYQSSIWRNDLGRYETTEEQYEQFLKEQENG